MRQEDSSKFEASQGYIVSPCLKPNKKIIKASPFTGNLGNRRRRRAGKS